MSGSCIGAETGVAWGERGAASSWADISHYYMENGEGVIPLVGTSHPPPPQRSSHFSSFNGDKRKRRGLCGWEGKQQRGPFIHLGLPE